MPKAIPPSNNRLNELKETLTDMGLSQDVIQIIIDLAKYDIRTSGTIVKESKHVVATSGDEFVEVRVHKIPSSAPALWSDKAARDGRDPYEFIKHYYGYWLNTGFSRVHLRALDMPLYYAYTMWERSRPPGVEKLRAKPPKQN